MTVRGRRLIAGALIGLVVFLAPAVAEAACPSGYTLLNIEFTSFGMGPCFYSCITYAPPFGDLSIPGGWVTIAGFQTCYNYSTQHGVIQYFVIQYFGCCVST